MFNFTNDYESKVCTLSMLLNNVLFLFLSRKQVVWKLNQCRHFIWMHLYNFGLLTLPRPPWFSPTPGLSDQYSVPEEKQLFRLPSQLPQAELLSQCTATDLPSKQDTRLYEHTRKVVFIEISHTVFIDY